MSEALSQKEIEQLLSAINSSNDTYPEAETEVKKRIKIYDFKRPDKFSKEQIRTISIIFENYSRFLSKQWSESLGGEFQIHVASVDQLSHEEFIRTIPNPTYLNVINVKKLGNMVMEIDIPITQYIENAWPEEKGQDYIYNTCENSLPCLMAAFNEIAEIDPTLGRIETNPQFLTYTKPEAMVLWVTLECIIKKDDKKIEGMINIEMPETFLEPIKDRLNSEFIYSTNKKLELPEMNKEKISKENIMKNLESVYTNISVRLGETKKTIKEIMNFDEGTVIELDKLAGEPAEIFVNNAYFGKGEIVVVDENFGIRITEINKI